MTREFITAKAQFLLDGSGGYRARVPASVRDKLGARPGDILIFEEGTTQTAERAALRGVYFVVRMEPGVSLAAEPPAAPVTAPAGSGESPDAQLESLAAAVARKRRGE
jgi:bifunctional DNA-binding transcriptional regulator/antitoxin component of YhaV-PrlF toxin-antitoxin module